MPETKAALNKSAAVRDLVESLRVRTQHLKALNTELQDVRQKAGELDREIREAEMEFVELVEATRTLQPNFACYKQVEEQIESMKSRGLLR